VFKIQTYTRVKFHMLSSSVLLGFDVNRNMAKSFALNFVNLLPERKGCNFPKCC
jgi:hypothetical protein